MKFMHHLSRLESKLWLLWGAAFMLLLAFAGTVHLLHVRLLTYIAELENTSSWLRDGYYAGVGLIGLVILFIFYTLFKQIQLQSLRSTLRHEEVELEDLRARLSELTALFQVATYLNLELSLDAILGIIVRRVVGALKAQQASIMLHEPESDSLVTRAYYGVEGEFALNGRRKMGEGIAGRVAQKGEALLLNQKPPDAEVGDHYKAHRQITSALSVPLRVGDRVVGVLNVNRISFPRAFTDRQRDVLKLFAEHVGAVIQRAETTDKLDRRATDLEKSNADLSEMNRMKDLFLSTASHELKTPLTSVIAYAELLTEHEDRLGPEERAEFLGRLKGEAERLLGLIEDIMDLTRLETGKVKLKRQLLSFNDLTRSAVETARPTGDRAQVRIEEEYDPAVQTADMDEVKVRQAMLNLIVNAIKFSPEGGCVRVRTSCGEDGLMVEVTDEGPGVAPEEISQIFTLFGQGLRKRVQGASGLGIGLHLVKRVVEMHDGTVGVTSREGQGSTFWIRLPYPATNRDSLAA